MTLERLSTAAIGGIRGVEHLNGDQLANELERGGRFVSYNWCVSILLMTFRRPSGVIYLAPGQSGIVAGLKYLLISLTLGWWGLPWGPIYTIGSVWQVLKGGNDCTQEIVDDIEIIFPEGFVSPEEKRKMTEALLSR